MVSAKRKASLVRSTGPPRLGLRVSVLPPPRLPPPQSDVMDAEKACSAVAGDGCGQCDRDLQHEHGRTSPMSAPRSCGPADHARAVPLGGMGTLSPKWKTTWKAGHGSVTSRVPSLGQALGVYHHHRLRGGGGGGVRARRHAHDARGGGGGAAAQARQHHADDGGGGAAEHVVVRDVLLLWSAENE